MESLVKHLEKTSALIGRSVSYLLLLMALITVAIVVMRYLFNQGSIAMQESVTYLHVAVFVLGMGYTLQENAHVRVDIFYQKMSERTQALVNIFGSIFLLIPFCLFTLWVSFPYVQRSWSMAEKSADAGGIPAVFLLKSFLIVLVAVLLFQAVIEISKNVLFILNKNVDADFSKKSPEKINKVEGV